MMRGLRPALAMLAMGCALPMAQAQTAPVATMPAADPANAPAPADPARVAAARPVVEKLFPVGTYRRMMGSTMSKMMDGMIGGMMKMPVAQIARISGVPADRLTDMSDASLEEVSAIIDPYFRERTKLGMDAMMGGMADMMDGFEPKVRDALTRAFARKFDVAQLGEITMFFTTPTGNRFASDYMSMMMDPDIMREMQALMPEMMKKMPDLAEKAKKAADSLPPPRKASDLSQAEKTKLARLMGVKTSDLEQGENAAQKADQADEGTE